MCLGSEHTAAYLHCVYHEVAQHQLLPGTLFRFKTVLYSEEQCFHGTWKVFCAHRSIRAYAKQKQKQKDRRTLPKSSGSINYVFELYYVRTFNFKRCLLGCCCEFHEEPSLILTWDSNNFWNGSKSTSAILYGIFMQWCCQC